MSLLLCVCWKQIIFGFREGIFGLREGICCQNLLTATIRVSGSVAAVGCFVFYYTNTAHTHINKGSCRFANPGLHGRQRAAQVMRSAIRVEDYVYSSSREIGVYIYRTTWASRA